jgi:hypothetical protein
MSFDLKPRISLSSRLDTNFFWAEENEREVFTFLIQPGVTLALETPKSRIRFDYTLEGYLYEDYNTVPPGAKSASDDNYVGHLAVLDALYRPRLRFTVGLNEFFNRTRDPALSDILSNSIERRKYDINRFTPLVFYDFGTRFSGGLRYLWQVVNYDDSDTDDSNEHRLLFNLLYNPTRSTTFDLDYQHWTLDYAESSFENYTSDQLKLIFEKRYKYYAFEAGAGYQLRNFDAPVSEDRGTFAYKVSVAGQNPPLPETRRYLGREYLKSKSHFYLSAERNFNNLGNLYTAYRFTLGAGHVFMEKILTRISGYYQMSDYDFFTGLTASGGVALREDKRYKISASVGYLIKRQLALVFTVGYENRDSNLVGYNFDNTFSMLRLDFNYDVGSRGGLLEEGAYY